MTKVINKNKKYTLIETIEKKYGIKTNYPPKKRLSVVLKETGAPSLSKLLNMADATKLKKQN